MVRRWHLGPGSATFALRFSARGSHRLVYLAPKGEAKGAFQG